MVYYLQMLFELLEIMMGVKMSGEIDNKFDINLDVHDESVDVDSSFNAQQKQNAIVRSFFEMGDSGEFYLKEEYFTRCSDYFENLFSVQPKNDEDWDSDYWDQHNRVMKSSSVDLRTYFEKKRFVIHGEIEDRDWYSGNHELQIHNAKRKIESYSYFLTKQPQAHQSQLCL